MDVRGPDGKIVRFPDGTSAAKVDEVMSAIYKPQSTDGVREGKRLELRKKMQIGTGGGLTDRAASAFSFGLGDEASGVASVVSNAIVSPFSSKVDFDPRGAFNRGKAEFDADTAAAKREAPVAATLADIAGVAGAIAVPTRTLSSATTLGGMMRTGATQGAVGGAIGGFGASDGGLGERAASSGVGALTGATLGGTIPVAGRVVGKGYRAVQRLAGRGEPIAPQMLSDALRADGLTPRQAGAIIDQARADGVPLALADVGDNTRGLASSVGRQPGPSRTIVRDMAIGRQEGQADRVAGAVARDLGPVSNPRAVSEQLLEQAKARAAPIYSEAYAAPTPITDDMTAILRRIPRGAIENAQRVAKLEGRNPQDLGVDFNEAGDVILKGKPSVETLDYIKRGLDDVVEKYRDKTTGRLVLDGEGRAVNNLLRDFTAEVDRVNPAYARARAAYAGPVRASAALSKGQSFANKTADDITAETRDLSPFELEHYRLGVRAAMTRAIEAKGDYANKVQALVGSPKKRAALNQVFGDSRDFDRFVRTLGHEARANHTYQAVAGNSATAGRIADDATTADGGLVDAASNAVVSVGSGNGIIPSIVKALREAHRYGVGEAGKEVRGQLAAALSETDPAVLREALRQAQRGQASIRVSRMGAPRVAQTQGRVGGQVAGVTLGQLAGQ